MIFLSDVPPTVSYMPTKCQAESSQNDRDIWIHRCEVRPSKWVFLTKNCRHFVENWNYGKKIKTPLGNTYLHILTKFQLNRTFLASSVKKNLQTSEIDPDAGLA